MKEALIIFLKNYKITKVKTRLAKDTSNDFARKIYKLCVKKIINVVKETNISYFLFWYPSPINFEKNSYLQTGKDLGEKMYNAFNKIFSFNFEKVVIIGSDIPAISKDLLYCSFNKLNFFDYVIGPCYDGGYYLIGTKRNKLDKTVFKNILWSTPKVLDQTLTKLKNKKYSYFLLKKLHDIDTIDDLKKYENFYNYSNL